MTPAFVVLSIYQGQTYNDVVILEEDDGTPLDLSGKAARMQVRDYRSGPLRLELTTENGMITLDEEGRITFLVSAAETAALRTQYDYEQWVFSLELVTDPGPDEIVETPIFGTVVFYPEITVN